MWVSPFCHYAGQTLFCLFLSESSLALISSYNETCPTILDYRFQQPSIKSVQYTQRILQMVESQIGLIFYHTAACGRLLTLYSSVFVSLRSSDNGTHYNAKSQPQ